MEERNENDIELEIIGDEELEIEDIEIEDEEEMGG